MTTARELMETWLASQAEQVQRNVEVVTPETAAFGDYDGSHMLHISTNTTLRKFVPVIGRRQAREEDRTVPRICVCPTLLGCFIGYVKAVWDVENLVANGSKEEDNEGYKGGWFIYAFDHEASLLPNKKMVPDVKRSDERWLTLFSPDHVEYKPQVAGKVFYHRITTQPTNDKLPYSHVEFFVEVRRPGGFAFSKNHYLRQGFYLIDGPAPASTVSWDSDSNFTVKEIDRETYYSYKKVSADMLSLPPFLRW
jgi:hypothetical protein